jgi:glycosyltransferase involved in cell wall biosynthesis
MKALLLAAPNSAHTEKWAKSLAQNGLQVYVFGLSAYDCSIYRNSQNIQVDTLGFEVSSTQSGEGVVSKLKYFRALPRVKKIIRDFNPDILHAHFASSYGLIAALSGFNPYIIYVWGDDILYFPQKSLLHKALIKYTLTKADRVLATSKMMVRETQKYASGEIGEIPFGIDVNVFKPQQVDSLLEKDDIVIGTIKGLDQQYGIEYLIRAFKILKDKYQTLPLKLMIAGDGPLEKNLKELVQTLNLGKSTLFTGRVSYNQVPQYHNMLSIYVALSVSESFGVAILEASACNKPVVVSDVGGLPEVVEDGVTGFIVPARDADQAAAAIERLIFDEPLRQKMGQAGRARVKKLYNWDTNVKEMINIYQDVLREHR